MQRDPSLPNDSGPTLRAASGVPGSKVLDDAFLVERVAIGVPRGRRAALGVAAAVLEEAKRDGTVRRAFDAAGYKDAMVAAAAAAAR